MGRFRLPGIVRLAGRARRMRRAGSALGALAALGLSACAAEHTVGSTGFAAGRQIALGFRPAAAQVGDADGDGHADVVLLDGDAARVCVLRGDGGGGLAAATCTALPAAAGALLVADLLQSGRPELVSAGGRLAVVAGGSVAGSLALPAAATALVAADVSQDGRPDVLAVLPARAEVAVFLTPAGDTPWPLQENARYPAPAGTTAALYADLDGDGAAELCAIGGGDAATGQPAGVTVLGRRGAASFPGCPAALPVGRPLGLGALDWDGDGRRDLVWVDTDAGALRRLRTLEPQPGTLRPQLGCPGSGEDGEDGAAPAPLPEGAGPPLAAAFTDADGDGQADAIVAHGPGPGGTPSVSVRLTRPAAGPGRPLAYPLPPGTPSGLALGDLDGDGHPEIVVPQADASALTVLPSAFR